MYYIIAFSGTVKLLISVKKSYKELHVISSSRILKMKSHGPQGVLVELLFYLEKLMNEQYTMKVKATSEMYMYM